MPDYGVFNSGTLDFRKYFLFLKRQKEELPEEELPLFKSSVRIPELDIECTIRWKGNYTQYYLTKESINLLTKNGKYKMYLAIIDYHRSEVIFKMPVVLNKDDDLKKDGCYIAYKDHACERWQMRGGRFNFVLLDEYERSFRDIPYTHPMDINQKKLVLKMKVDIGQLDISLANADFTIKCKDGSIKAHKHILAIRSGLFKKMFTDETSETKTDFIECDFDIKLMKSVMNYIYKGKFEKAMAHELYKAGDFYDLSDLKMMCEKMIMQDLTISNVISELTFAEAFNLPNLKNKALACITWYSEDIKKNQEYLKMKSSEKADGGNFLSLIEGALAAPKQKFVYT